MGTILVTGATGFTGSVLCRRLVGRGERVVAFVRRESDRAALADLDVECREVDLGRRSEIDSAFERFDRVYHIAAAYRAELADRDQFRQVNVEGTRSLLEASMRHGVGRFVHCSTVGVQGEIEDPPATEDYRVAPGDHYQTSKLEGERLALQTFERGLPGTVVRPVGIYGPGDRRFLKLFSPIARGRFVMIGSGQVLYQLTYIDDLIDGFLLAGSRDEALGEVFTIGGARYTTLRELVETIAEVLGRPRPRLRVPLAPVMAAAVVCEAVCRPFGIQPPLFPRRVEFFKLDRAFSIEKARRLLGYEPRVDLLEGLTRTVAAYREKGWI